MNGSAADVTTQTIAGRDGDLIMSNNRFNSFQQDVNVAYHGEHKKIKEQAEKFKQLLLKDVKFHDFQFSDEQEYVYQAAFVTAFHLTWVDSEQATQTLSFNMMPFKYVKSGQSYQTITTGVKLNNTGTIPAKPVIKITGSGDCTVQIGSKSVSLKGINGGIIMDTDSQLCTNLASTRTQFDKMYGDFMTIPTGNQTVTITGKNITKVEIKPRWAVRA